MQKHVDYRLAHSDNDLPVAESILEEGIKHGASSLVICFWSIFQIPFTLENINTHSTLSVFIAAGEATYAEDSISPRTPFRENHNPV
jgi:hypothetical protein